MIECQQFSKGQNVSNIKVLETQNTLTLPKSIRLMTNYLQNPYIHVEPCSDTIDNYSNSYYVSQYRIIIFGMTI